MEKNEANHELVELLTHAPIPPRCNMVDLFAGTGAFSLAFSSMGANIVYANDFGKYSKLIYDNNIPGGHHVLGDINDINATDIPAHDILTASFPCQPFSIAGLREGFKDIRANVFWKLLEIITHHRPICIVLENVKNIVTHDDGKTMSTIITSLESVGYYVRHIIMDTATTTGIPQHRERIYIYCRNHVHGYIQWIIIEIPSG